MLGRRAGILLVVLLGFALGPVPVRRAQPRRPVHLSRAIVGGDEAKARRRHQALLRARHRDVHAPVVHVERHAAERGHRVHHQQCVVARGADRLADRGDVVHHARGGVDLHHQHGLDGATAGGLAIGPEARLDLGRADGAAHVALQHLDFDAHATGVLAPAHREAAALQRQDPVAAGQHVGERRLPRAVPIGAVDVSMPSCVEHARHVAHQPFGQRQQRAGIDLHSRSVHRPQHLVRHRRRPRNGQEFAARAHAHSDTSSAPPRRRGCVAQAHRMTNLIRRGRVRTWSTW